MSVCPECKAKDSVVSVYYYDDDHDTAHCSNCGYSDKFWRFIPKGKPRNWTSALAQHYKKTEV